MSLNKEQNDCIKSPHAINIVSAGAGTGKTKTVIARACSLAEGGRNVLVTTFTRAAAEEIIARLPKQHEGIGNIYVFTLGSLAWHISGENPADQSKVVQWVRDEIKAIGLDHKHLSAHRSKTKDAFVTEMVLGLERLVSNNVTQAESHDIADNALRQLYPAYLERGPLMQSGMSAKAIAALDGDDEYAEELREKFCIFDAIIVDEAQDLNEVQGCLIEKIRQKTLAKTGKTVILDYVGDPDQSIYSWRGGIPDYMDPMIQSFSEPDCGYQVLKQNYRSTREIIKVALEGLSMTDTGEGKELVAQTGGDPVIIDNAPTERSEAQKIVSLIEEAVSSGTPLREIAVIARRHSRLDFIESHLQAKNIPYSRSQQDYYDRPDVKAYQLAFEIATKKGEALLEAIYEMVRLRTADRALERRLKKSFAKANAATFHEDMWSAIEEAVRPAKQAANPTPAEIDRQAFLERHFGPFLQALLRINQENASGKEQSLDVTNAVLGGLCLPEWFASLPQWKARSATISSVSDNFTFIATSNPSIQSAYEALMERKMQNETIYDRNGADAVFLTTPYGAKGLEWDFVIGCGLIEGEFPSSFAMKYQPESSIHYRFNHNHSGGMDEERRLFYVLVTRARKRLHLTWPMTARNIRGGSYQAEMSSFLRNITAINKSRTISKKGSRK